MTELEKRINAVMEKLAPSSKTGIALSGIKKTLYSSSHIADAVNNLGDRLQGNVKEEVGGITGAVSGWVTGKTTKFVGGIAGGIIAGTLKTVAGIIPDSSDIKLPESDKKLAHCIDTYSLPHDKKELFDLLQFIGNTVNSKTTPYGKQALESFKNLHSKVQSTFLIVAKDDKELLQLAQPFLPKKRLSIF